MRYRNIMQYLDLIDEIRNQFISCFEQKIIEINGIRSYEIEPIKENQDGSLILTQQLILPARSDLAFIQHQNQKQYIEVSSNGEPCFMTLEFDHRPGVYFKLSPFRWNRCALYLNKDFPEWMPLINWYEDRFKAKPLNHSQFSNCVHSLSDPNKITAVQHKLLIDLGTAPIAVFLELLDIIPKMGVARFEIGTG